MTSFSSTPESLTNVVVRLNNSTGEYRFEAALVSVKNGELVVDCNGTQSRFEGVQVVLSDQRTVWF